jgi:hypothetical protein
MDGAMDSMMVGVMGLGWLPALLAVSLVIAGVVALLSPAGTPQGAGIGKRVLATLAVIGGFALVVALALD